MNELLHQKWQELLRVWAVNDAQADRTFEDVCKHYAESGRFYHTLDHVQDMLETVESIASFTRNLNAVKLATWLHDVIYDSRASDNEERCATYAERLCEEFSIPDRRLVASLILKTKTHDAGDDPDAQVLLDADLAILGESESIYRAYAEKIRQEYAWVPEADYRKGRQAVLQKFLSRPKIFHVLTHLESPARRNLADEIARLAGTCVPSESTQTSQPGQPVFPSVEADLFGAILEFHKKVTTLLRQSSLDEAKLKVVADRIKTLLDGATAETQATPPLNLKERLQAVYEEARRLVEES